jgi:hypothetical protein
VDSLIDEWHANAEPQAKGAPWHQQPSKPRMASGWFATDWLDAGQYLYRRRHALRR